MTIPVENAIASLSLTNNALKRYSKKKSFLAKELAKINPISIRNGFKYSLLEGLLGNYGIDREELIQVSRIAPATLNRRKQQGQLTSLESDKVYRLMTILYAAENLFEGDKLKALYWCRKPAKGLGDQKPIDFVDTTAGQDLVMDYIGRIEHGIIT